jgi:PAS domain S-box-containing protein
MRLSRCYNCLVLNFKELPRSGDYMDIDSSSDITRKTNKGGLRKQYCIVAAVLAVGLLLSFLSFLQQRHREYDLTQQDFEKAAHNRILAMRKILEIDFLAIESIKNFYDGSQLVDRDEFTTFVTPLLENNNSINSLQWIPRVTESERAKFQSEASRDLKSNVRIVEYDKGFLVEAPTRAEYYPYYYVEPPNSSAARIGYNLGTVVDCEKAMIAARDSGEAATTQLIFMPEDPEQHPRLRIFMPIYKRFAPIKTVEERRQNLKGFIVGILSVDGIIEESFETLMPAGLDIYVFNEYVPLKNKILHYHPSRIHKAEYHPIDLNDEIRQSGMSLSDKLLIAGKIWDVICLPSPEFIVARSTWQPWVNGIGGLLLSGLLASYLLTVAIRNHRTAELASQLAGKNKQLENEIADRKNAEDESQRENAKLSAMLSVMDEGVIFANADNIIIESNNYLCEFMCKSRKDIIGKRIEDFHHGEHLKRVLSHIDKFRKEVITTPLVFQRHVMDKDVIFRMQPIYRDGIYDGMLLNIIDVSEFVRARQQAEAADKAKSKFLANMSHEMRTPMASILGYTDLLMDPNIDCSNRNNYLMVVHRNSENMLHLINDILDLSKIETGKMTLNEQRCNLVAMLAEVASIMRSRAEMRGNSLIVQYQSELPETINTDPGRLRQAIVNLVGNAVKFTENGQVRIDVLFLRQWRDGKPAIKIAISDTGIGIRREVLPGLFQPFSQGDINLSQKYGGTGLGLAISRHIAEMLGGDLTVESVLGKGSTFTLIVPSGDLKGIKLFEQPSEIMEDFASACATNAKELSGLKILVAEDSIDNQQLIRVILNKAGASVVIAENGKIALNKAETDSFDVILMDMNMPEMDGCEATQILRERGYDRPILALTANAMADDKERCLAAGCDSHLSKPIDRAKLIKAIAHYAGLEPPESQESPQNIKETTQADKERIISLYVDDPDIMPILEGYIVRLGGQVQDMRAALASAQFPDLQRLAHQMKGSGGNYGYPMLTEAAKDLEDAAKAKDIQSAAKALHRVASLCGAIEKGYDKQTSIGVNGA